jgi:hypothetical protein
MLIIAKLDRLSRDAHFVLGLQPIALNFSVLILQNATAV